MSIHRALLTLVLTALLVPSIASAHARKVVRIGEENYLIVVGSQNEPVAVDDKTGVELRVSKVASSTDASGAPVEGLETKLKTEIVYGKQSRVQSFSTIYGQPGAYASAFRPTAKGEYTYRIFGDLAGTAIDLSFACHPGGHVMGGAPDTTVVDLGGGAKQVLSAGSFGCPMDVRELGFPAPVTPNAQLAASVAASERVATKLSNELHLLEILLGILAVGFAAVTSQKRRALKP